MDRIKKECRLIDSTKWENTDVVYFDDSDILESAALTIYKDKDGTLKKLDAIYFKELGKQLESFYIVKGNLVLASYQIYEYNRPYYWSDSMARDNGDSVSFDIAKSFIVASSYYFDGKDHKLVLETEEKKGPEQTLISEPGKAKEIMDEFEKLKTLANKK